MKQHPRYQYARLESGQALLIVVLVMVIALTVGLSLASRSITNLRNSTDEANSQAAFAAAEAGVEQAVKLGGVSGNSVIAGVSLNDKNNSQISNVDITTISGNQVLLNNGNPIFQDDGIDVWLSPHTDDPAKLFATSWNGTLYVNWGTSSDPSGCSDPAIEVMVLYGTRLNPGIKKYAYDPCAARRSVNSFAQPPVGAYSVNGVNGNMTYNYQIQLYPGGSISNGLLARITPLYKAGSIGVIGAGLPIQGKLITSTGTAGVGSSSQTVRKISFFQGFDSVPSELFYSFFTPQ